MGYWWLVGVSICITDFGIYRVRHIAPERDKEAYKGVVSDVNEINGVRWVYKSAKCKCKLAS